jgi:serine/threonine-protein kinase RsbW
MRSSDVVLTVPADSSYVCVVRTATSAVCARADFTVDALDDVRLAVDEACALAIADAPAGSDMTVTLRAEGATVTIDIAAASATGQPVSTTSFAWTVLTALVDRVQTEVADGSLHIQLRSHGIESVAS